MLGSIVLYHALSLSKGINPDETQCWAALQSAGDLDQGYRVGGDFHDLNTFHHRGKWLYVQGTVPVL